jgi:steroid 5-alpha reductase family enzyme
MAAFVGLGAILTTLTLVWMISVRLRDASVADICWGLCFVLLAWVYCFLSPTLTPRSWLVAALITLWVRDCPRTSSIVTTARMPRILAEG